MSSLRQLYRSIQAHAIARDIKSFRPDLRHLADEKVIRFYFREERAQDKAADSARPISKLYERVLLFENTLSKAFYIREHWLSEDKYSASRDEVSESARDSSNYQRIAGMALAITQAAIDKLDNAGLDLKGRVNRN